MSKIITTVVTSLFLLGCANAQDSYDEAVSIPLIIKSNSIAKIDYSHAKTKDGKTNTGNISGILKVIEKTEDGFKGSWTTQSVKVPGMTITEKSPQAASMLIGIPFSFIGISDGQPLRIDDKEKLLSKLSDSSVFENTEPEVLASVIALFEGMDEETLAHVMIKIPSYMSVCQNSEFHIGEPLKQQVEAPNPFGEGVLISDISYELKSIDRKKNIGIIEYKSGFNSESLKNLTLELFKKIAPEKTPSSEEMEALEIDRQDYAKCSVNLSTGWVQDMTYHTIVKGDGETQEEFFDISIKWLD